MSDDDFVDELDPPPSPELMKDTVNATLKELGETPHSLAVHFRKLGDYRPIATIERSIQRMASGETKVAGEMMATFRLLLRNYRRAKEDVSNIDWTRVGSKTGPLTEGYYASHRGWDISLTPQTKGRWLVTIRLPPGGFSPSWPAWQENLEAAKIKAVDYIDQVMNEPDFIIQP